MSSTLPGTGNQLAMSGDASAAGIQRGPRLRQLRGALYRVGLPIAGVVATVLIWHVATTALQVRSFLFPAPYPVAQWLWNNTDVWLEHGRITVYETLAGFGLGAAAGLVTAVVLLASPHVERALLPLVISLNAIPKVALAPLFVVWFGLEGHTSKIALAASICFFPVMISTMAGLSATPAELGELARSLSAPRWKAFLKVRVPWALPQVFVGLKLGMTLAVIGAVVAEMTRPSGGLGTLIYFAGQNAATTTIFAAVVALMVISITLFYTVVVAERLLLPWARATTAARL